MSGWAAALVMASAATQPLQQGLWRVITLIQGADHAETHLVCATSETAWVRVAVPTLGSAACIAPVPAKGAVDVTGRCFGGGGLKITGVLKSERFELVARRWGPAGFNAGAQAVATTQGVLIAPACASKALGAKS